MTTKDVINLKELSRSEKILLVEDLWDEIEESGEDDFPLTPEQRSEIDRRWEAFKKNPSHVYKLSDIKKEIFGS